LSSTPPDVGYVNRWTAVGVREQRFPVDVGQALYTMEGGSDNTGVARRTNVRPPARWSQIVDGLSSAPRWYQVEWTSTVPAGATLVVRARAAAQPGDFSAGTATAFCTLPSSPASLVGCSGLNGERYLQIEATLTSPNHAALPVLTDV